MERWLLLKFGAGVTVTFTSEEQMRLFLETHCYKSKNGKIYFHHGIFLHSFEPLRPCSYKDIPEGVKMRETKQDFYLFKAYTGKELRMKRERELEYYAEEHY